MKKASINYNSLKELNSITNDTYTIISYGERHKAYKYKINKITNLIGGNPASDLILNPTSKVDGYSVVWNNSENRYTLENISGSSSRDLIMQKNQTSGFTPIVGNMYPVDVSSSSFQISAPSSPSAGDRFGITDSSRSMGSNFLRINFTADKFGSSSVSIDINYQDATATFEYVDSTIGWVLISGSLT